MSNKLIFLICLMNISCAVLFLFCGVKIGKATRTIIVKQNETVEELHKPVKYDYNDEPAFEVTPEMEREYEASLRKRGVKNEL